MPFYIFKLWRETGALELLEVFTDAPLTEADTYRRAAARLRGLRREVKPKDGYYLHLHYGTDEVEARAKLLHKLGL